MFDEKDVDFLTGRYTRYTSIDDRFVSIEKRLSVLETHLNYNDNQSSPLISQSLVEAGVIPEKEMKAEDKASTRDNVVNLETVNQKRTEKFNHECPNNYNIRSGRYLRHVTFNYDRGTVYLFSDIEDHLKSYYKGALHDFQEAFQSFKEEVLKDYYNMEVKIHYCNDTEEKKDEELSVCVEGKKKEEV